MVSKLWHYLHGPWVHSALSSEKAQSPATPLCPQCHAMANMLRPQTSQHPAVAKCPAALRDSAASHRQPYHAAPYSRTNIHIKMITFMRAGGHTGRLRCAAEPQRSASARASKAPASSSRSSDFAAGFQAKGLEAELFRELLLLASSTVGKAGHEVGACCSWPLCATT